jgi:hypothetical protein
MAFPSLFILFTYLNNGGFLMQSSSSTYIHTNFIITSIIFLSKFESTCANELDLNMHKILIDMQCIRHYLKHFSLYHFRKAH